MKVYIIEDISESKTKKKNKNKKTCKRYKKYGPSIHKDKCKSESANVFVMKKTSGLSLLHITRELALLGSQSSLLLAPNSIFFVQLIP